MQLGKHSGGTKEATVDRNYMFGGFSSNSMPGMLRPEKPANSDQREGRLRKKAKALGVNYVYQQ